jgi:hypothetical protein
VGPELVALIFFISIGLYAYSRFRGSVSTESNLERDGFTEAGKIRHSKTDDITFFDGESIDWNDSFTRMRRQPT